MPLARLPCFAAVVATALELLGPARADPYLADFPYPYPVARLDFRSQEQDLWQDLWMSYMDISAARPNGRTVVLLHGKNFCGATWEGIIPALSDAGYRVIVPDQVGFCRSAKPRTYQFSLHQLAANTQALLANLNIERPIIAPEIPQTCCCRASLERATPRGSRWPRRRARRNRTGWPAA